MNYEQQRLANIAANKALLESLGLSEPLFAPPVAAPSARDSGTYAEPVKASKKRGQVSTPTNAPKKKKSRKSETPASSPAEGVRRSARTANRRISYADLDDRSIGSMPTKGRGKEDEEDEYDELESDVQSDGDQDYKKELQRKSVKLAARTENPTQFGHIPGIEVGTTWKFRSEVSQAAVHSPYVAGIFGTEKTGAYSIVLSGGGGYDDDVDEGYAFTYSGAGGRSLKGTKDAPKNLRTAPQTFDQTFGHPSNRALQVSSETKNPVRVIRGYQVKSIYAPTEKQGYRYDGLYIVEKAWLDDGLAGFKVCRYALRRMDGQPPIPTRECPDFEVARPSSTEKETESETKEDSEETEATAKGSESDNDEMKDKADAEAEAEVEAGL